MNSTHSESEPAALPLLPPFAAIPPCARQPPWRAAAACKAGNSRRQGPHQVAQKFSTTAFPLAAESVKDSSASPPVFRRGSVKSGAGWYNAGRGVSNVDWSMEGRLIHIHPAPNRSIKGIAACQRLTNSRFTPIHCERCPLGPCVRRCGRRKSPAAPGSDWPATARCDSCHSRPGWR